jgi:superfamily II DNA or RNA helicase
MTASSDEALLAWAERIEGAERAAQSGTTRPLRNYQTTAVDAVCNAIDAGQRRILLQLPTGGGKTRIAAELIKQEFDAGERVLFIVPRLSLIEQSARSFEAEGIADVGVIQGRHHRTNRHARAQVASVQTLGRRKLPDGIGLAIVDEAHLQFKTLQKVMGCRSWAQVPFVGLSATPWSKGLGKWYRLLLKPVSAGELIGAGHLVPPKVFCPPGPDLSGVKITAGDFNEGQLSKAVNTTELVGNVIQTWLAKGEQRPTLVYGVDRAHAQHLQERFIEAGIAAAYIDGETAMFEREDIFEQFRCDDVKVITSVGCLDTGLDLPMASCIVDARPTQSEMRHVQTIGRGLRTFPGKVNCIVLDHAGNTRRLGLVTDIDYDVLDDGTPAAAAKRKAAKRICEAIFCGECHAQLPVPKPRVCPDCGKIFYAVTPVKERDGELVEYGSNRSGNAAEPSPATKAIWHGALLRIARERGYKAGWATYKYREKFGHWPPRFPATECEPTVEIRNWVWSRTIAYAKARTSL